MKKKQISLYKEVIIIVIAGVFSFVVFSNFDALEFLVDVLEEYEDYELDEILPTSLILVPLIFIFLIRRLREANENQRIFQNKNKELLKAMDEIRQLRGILPLCSFCKKVRNDSGYWEQVEIYIETHSQAEISHGVCPDCMKKHYPKYI